jgi:hypothetical protein
MKSISRSAFAALVLFGLVATIARPADATPIAYITGGNSIWAWNTNTNSVSLVTNTGGGVDSLIFDPQGNIVYSQICCNALGRFNTSTLTNSILNNAAGPGVADMTLEPGGNSLLVSDAFGTTIGRLNLTTLGMSFLNVGTRPDGLAYDNNGHLFAVLGLNSVAQIDPTTGAIIKSISTPNQPDGLTFDATTGMLYVASDGGGFYTVPTDLSSATFTSVLTPSGAGYVFDGIASDDNLLLFVVRGQGGLLYDLNTHTVLETSPFISGADDIAPVTGLGAPVTAAPEPATFALLGSGLIALARRRVRPGRIRSLQR